MQGEQLGPFQLEEQIGAGGMGVVYRARYTKNGRLVALKLLSPGLVQEPRLIKRFERELEILKKLQHPHIVTFYGGGRKGPQRYYAMEYVEGGTLSQLLREKGRLPWQDVVRYGLEICSALDHAHEAGVVHRDLKPANLMLDRQGRIKLADFGLARVTDGTVLTAAGKTLGTFAYMAPEQISGKLPITAKTDLYALGCVLFELLTGHPPFQAEAAAELFYEHLKKKPPRICTEILDCPVWLESIVLQLLEKDPTARPRDALAVAQALQEAEEKARQNAAVVAHVTRGEPTAIQVPVRPLEQEGDALTEAQKLLRAKKKKRARETGPIYERTWFLATCLGVLLLLITYSLLPLSEAQLYERGAKLMASTDPLDWDKARSRYLDPYLKRFPGGPHAAEVQEFVDRIEMQRAEARILNRIANRRDMENEAEQLFARAYEFERFGDRITAAERYAAMARLLADRAEHRGLVLAARKRAAALEQGDDAGAAADRQKLIVGALARADAAMKSGDRIEARQLCESIIRLYGEVPDLAELVEAAESRLDEWKAGRGGR